MSEARSASGANWHGVLRAIVFGVSALSAAAAVPASLPGTGMRQNFTGDNITGTLYVPGETIPRFGFIPIRLATDNQQSRELRWQAGFELTSANNNGLVGFGRSAMSLTVPASRSGERWLFVSSVGSGLQPSGGYSPAWSNLVVTLDGPGLSGKRLNFSAGGRGNNMVPWAVSAALESAVRSHLVALKTEPPPARATSHRPGRAIVTGPQPLIRGAPNLFVFDPMQDFGDWRIWSSFARVILGTDEFAALPPANRAALHGWVALGGALYLVPTTGGATSLRPHGAGSIITLGAPISPTTEDNSDGLFLPYSIFSPSLALPVDLSLQKGGLADKVPPAKRAGDWLVYFFIGFAVLVAPVNLFAIAPVKRRHWLFISVPLISVVAVAVLFVAIYLQDGVGGAGARRSLVVLLPGNNQAAVFQEQVSRTGLLLGASFPLAEDTLCAPVPADDANFQPGRPLEYVRQNGQASGDWFRGRARQGQHLRRLTPTRARVEVVGRSPDGAPIVQSSVGATLRRFCYIDDTGAAWQADALAPGARVTLSRAPLALTALGERTGDFSEVTTPYLQSIVQVATGQGSGTPDLTRRGRFLAHADDSDLAPLPTLATIRWRDSAVLITGYVETGGSAAGKAPR